MEPQAPEENLLYLSLDSSNVPAPKRMVAPLVLPGQN